MKNRQELLLNILGGVPWQRSQFFRVTLVSLHKRRTKLTVMMFVWPTFLLYSVYQPIGINSIINKFGLIRKIARTLQLVFLVTLFSKKSFYARCVNIFHVPCGVCGVFQCVVKINIQKNISFGNRNSLLHNQNLIRNAVYFLIM